MDRTYYKNYYLLLLLAVSSVSMYANVPMLFTGSIQFPSHIKSVPPIQIYSQGCSIQGIVDNATHRITYALNRPRTIQRFWLVITSHLAPIIAENTEHNTVQCWQVDTTQPYKFYSLTRVIEDVPSPGLANSSPRMRWDIQMHNLSPFNGVLPDETVIVFYDPTIIKDLRGGSPFEWPAIMVRDDVLALVESENGLHALSEKLSLAAMDLRPFFSPVEYEMRQTAHVKTIIALSTT